MEETAERESEEETPEGRTPIPFFPDFALREALAAAALFAALVVLASIPRPSLEPPADPNASGYVPRPEWYFLWLFQSLKYFEGPLEIIGTFVIPTLALALVFSVPFLDRRPAAKRALLPGTRPVRFWPRLAGAAAMALVGTLTFMAWSSEAPLLRQEPALTPVQAAGKALYGKMGCPSCHEVADAGGARGPSLTDFGSRPDAEERVLIHFAGIARKPGSIMPGYQLSPDELRALSSYLLSLKGR